MIETPAEILAHHATRQAADSFTRWRKQIKKPLSETAALRIAKTLAAINAAGGDASDALGMAEENGWQSIKEDWYFGQRNRNAARSADANAAGGKIAIAARFARTPTQDSF